MFDSRSHFVLAAVAVLVLAPMLAVGIVEAHSSVHSLLWASQFAEQFRAGILYPRWLPESFHGLGAPTFYFYPPVPFWFDAIVSVVTLDALPVGRRLGVTSVLILYVSGVAMYAWLQRETGSRTGSLIGSAAYMIAPYRLLDHYVRGAFAEYSAYAVLPLVMLAIRLIADRRRAGPPLLTATYAAMLMTHLPISLVATITIVPLYVLFRAWRCGDNRVAARLIAQVIAAGILGLGLAAVYLVPALSLQDSISADVLWGPAVRPENWLLLARENWIELPPHFLMNFFSPVAVSAALSMVVIFAVLPLMQAGDPGRWEAAFWAVLTLFALAMMAGLFPWVWSIPWISKVQFPWRLLLVIEFTAITAFCLSLPRIKTPCRGMDYVFATVAVAALVAAAVALAPAVGMLVRDAESRVEFTVKNAPLRQWEALEYLPHGYGRIDNQGKVDLGGEMLPALPQVTCVPAAIVCRADQRRFGALGIVVESETPTIVILRRFAFPGWRISGGYPVTVTDTLRLVSFVAPAGYTAASLERVMLPAELVGAAISGLSFVLIVVAMAVTARRGRPGDPT